MESKEYKCTLKGYNLVQGKLSMNKSKFKSTPFGKKKKLREEREANAQLGFILESQEGSTRLKRGQSDSEEVANDEN